MHVVNIGKMSVDTKTNKSLCAMLISEVTFNAFSDYESQSKCSEMSSQETVVLHHLLLPDLG